MSLIDYADDDKLAGWIDELHTAANDSESWGANDCLLPSYATIAAVDPTAFERLLVHRRSLEVQPLTVVPPEEFKFGFDFMAAAVGWPGMQIDQANVTKTVPKTSVPLATVKYTAVASGRGLSITGRSRSVCLGSPSCYTTPRPESPWLARPL